MKSKKEIKNKNVSVIKNETYALLSNSRAALVTSGTATLEASVFKIPQVVCYKSSWISYQIAKKLIKVKYISLVNLIMDKEVVKELIQEEFNTKNLSNALKVILDTKKRSDIFINYYDLEKKLGGKGASEKTAKFIFKSIVFFCCKVLKLKF